MHAYSMFATLSLFLFIVSSDARASNVSTEDKGEVIGVVNAQKKLQNLGLASFAVIEDDPDAVLTTWDDLKTVGITTDILRDGYQRIFGVRPNNQHMNDAFTHKNGWYSYNRRGPIKVVNIEERPKTSIAVERYITNDDDAEITYNVDLTATVTDSATATVTSRSQISTTASVSADFKSLGLGLNAELSTAFTFANEVGSSKTKYQKIIVGAKNYPVTIPPHSKKNVSLVLSWISKTADWEIPITIDPMGLTGVDFHRQVNGHFYWGVYHSTIANPPFTTRIRGRFDASYGTKADTVISDM